MPIIIPQFDLQAEFPDLDSEDSEGEETGKDITGPDKISGSAILFTNKCIRHRNIAFLQACQLQI
jgi:hypothetical protein